MMEKVAWITAVFGACVLTLGCSAKVAASGKTETPGSCESAVTRPAPKIPEPFLLKTNPRALHITQRFDVTNHDYRASKVVVIMPVAGNNPYQDVSALNTHGGEVLALPSGDDRCVRYILTGAALPDNGQTVSLVCEYDVKLYDIAADLGRITAVPEYDRAGVEYQRNTGPGGAYVDPANGTIQSIGGTLWAQSSGRVDYARRCYEYTARHFSYLNPNTGLHPLATLLQDGGGDCGNLSSIFISLLRAKGIPARHLVTMRPDGSAHVWADFYLERYGWIPVDVTYKQSNPGGNFFGKVAVGTTGVILNKSVDLTLDLGGETRTVALLQEPGWWYWGTGAGKCTSSYTFSGKAIP